VEKSDPKRQKIGYITTQNMQENGGKGDAC
jgi:hypothetical protein